MVISLSRTDSQDSDFVELVGQLDRYLAEIDGDETPFYSQYNKIVGMKHCLVAYENESPVGCGAIKQFDKSTVEIKRMFTVEASRGKGVATRIVEALEVWAGELGYDRCILETGRRQPNAIALYLKSGYKKIENYEPYVGVENSVCFEKQIKPALL